jgi:hypothetical protein
MKITTKILIVLVAVAVADIITPIPIAAFFLIYALHLKPVWFKDLVEKVYRD